MIFRIENLTKQYNHKGSVIKALDNVSLTIEKGSFVTITGASGSGKSTLLFTIGGLIHPTSGSIQFNQQFIHNGSDKVLSEFRKNQIGYILQNYALIPYLTAEENVMLPMLLVSKEKKKQKKIAAELLETVGLGDRIHHYPKELSAGQQQRVAIARALANNPSIILADEPTGNLDPELAKDILLLLKKLNSEKAITIIMVTHSPEAASFGNVKINLVKGKIEKDMKYYKTNLELRLT